MVRRSSEVGASARSSSPSCSGTRWVSAGAACSSEVGGGGRPLTAAAFVRPCSMELNPVNSVPEGVARVRVPSATPGHVLVPEPPAVPEHRSPATGNRLKRAIVHLYAALHRWGESGWAGSAVGGWGVLQGSV